MLKTIPTKVEGLHPTRWKLRRAISYANGGKLRVRTEFEQQICIECGRLLANNIILYNARFLSDLLEIFEKVGNTKIIEIIKKISPVAWQQFNFYGRFEFKKLVQLIPFAIMIASIKWENFLV